MMREVDDDGGGDPRGMMCWCYMMVSGEKGERGLR